MRLPQPTVVLAASDHGLGHATRCAAVGRALVERGIAVAFRSSAPASIFERLGPVVGGPTDIGLVQSDAVTVDLALTRARWDDWIARWPVLVAEEAVRLRELGADLVVADVPPLAIAAARHASLPAIALGNFGWDWIHEELARARRDDTLLAVARHIAAQYATAELLLHLPLSEPMRAFRVRETIPLVARVARESRATTRARLGIADDAAVALLSFGGGGLRDLDLSGLAADAPEWVLVAPGFATRSDPRVVPLGFDDVFHPDLVLAADVVVSKPGYGIVSECLAHGRPMLYVERGDFPEQPIVARAIERDLAGVRATIATLRAGRVGATLRALAIAGRALPHRDATGAAAAADRIADRARAAVRVRRPC